MGLVVAFPTGHTTGGGEGDAGTLAAWYKAGVDVVFAKIYLVTRYSYLDLAMGSAGQVKDPNRRWSYQ